MQIMPSFPLNGKELSQVMQKKICLLRIVNGGSLRFKAGNTCSFCSRPANRAPEYHTLHVLRRV